MNMEEEYVKDDDEEAQTPTHTHHPKIKKKSILTKFFNKEPESQKKIPEPKTQSSANPVKDESKPASVKINSLKIEEQKEPTPVIEVKLSKRVEQEEEVSDVSSEITRKESFASESNYERADTFQAAKNANKKDEKKKQLTNSLILMKKEEISKVRKGEDNGGRQCKGCLII